MSNRIAVQLGRALIVPFAMLCGAATAAGPLPALPTAASPQSISSVPSLASAPSAVSSVPAMPGTSLTSSASQDAASGATLPGLDGLGDKQGKLLAMRAKSSTNGIRPIRVPGGNLPLPITLPGS